MSTCLQSSWRLANLTFAVQPPLLLGPFRVTRSNPTQPKDNSGHCVKPLSLHHATDPGGEALLLVNRAAAAQSCPWVGLTHGLG